MSKSRVKRLKVVDMEEEIPNRQDMIYFQVFYQVFGILLIKSEKIVSTLNTVAKTLA